MYNDIKYIRTLLIPLLLWAVHDCKAADFITITAPTNGSTVSGAPLVVTGTSSQPNTRVQFIFNSVDIGSLTTDGSGNFAASFASVASGTYSLTLNLLDNNAVLLATTSISFTVSNPTIAILTPSDNAHVFYNPVVVTGGSSLASTTVDLSINGSLAGTTTTDGSGNWSISVTTGLYGLQTILAELKVSGVTVASSTIDANITIINRVIKGTVPTSGSGSDTGFTYTTSGLSTIITYVSAFANTPVVTATATNALGISTVGVTSSSTSSVTLGWSLGATSIHFVATAFS